MLKQLSILQLLMLLCISAFSQNLVPNPGFEEFYNCPDKLSQFHNVVNWYTPTIGNPDYYNNCKERKNEPFGIPYNVYGMQQPKSGNAYCGLVMYNGVNERLVEYVQIKLTKALTANAYYKLSFYISLSESSKFAINTVEASISNDAVNSNFWEPIIQKSIVRFSNTEVLENKETWTEVSAEFYATGGEQYVTIGNFALKTQSIIKQLDEGDKTVAYYYLDDVSLVEIPKPVKTAVTTTATNNQVVGKSRKNRKKNNRLGRKPTNIKKKVDSSLPSNVMSVDPVYFKYNSTELLASSYPNLDELVELLNTYTAMGLTIKSHTDRSATELQNQNLSHDRADAIIEYLEAHNIDRNRITVKCMGGTNPTSNNTTASGRQMNRRIDFLITRLPQ